MVNEISKILLDAREGVSSTTEDIYRLFIERQRCMDIIAKVKVEELGTTNGDNEDLSVIRLQREVELLEKYSNKAKIDGENPDIVKMLIWYLMYAGKMKQLDILGKETVFGKEELSDEILIENLKKLTKVVAPNYNVYGKEFDGTVLVRSFEKDIIRDISEQIPDKRLAIDLGTANGDNAKYLKDLGFEEVNGYDISSDMLDIAIKKNNVKGVNFEQVNLFEGIPLGSSCVDFIISNFGSASEVNENIFKEVNRVLKPGGKAFLSFYNEDSISNSWWQPLQNSIGVILNKGSNLLEVPILGGPDGSKVYKIYAQPYSINKITLEVSNLNLSIDSVGSFSPALTLTPSLFFDSKERLNILKEYEEEHYFNGPYLGFYITVVVTKKRK